MRPAGMRRTQSSAISGFAATKSRVMSLAKYPGAMAFTRMPSGSHSIAALFVNIDTAAFDVL